MIFASDDEQDRILWVQAMYRATGQSHKPVPPTQVQKLNSKGGTAPQLDAPISQFCKFFFSLSLSLILSYQTDLPLIESHLDAVKTVDTWCDSTSIIYLLVTLNGVKISVSS